MNAHSSGSDRATRPGARLRTAARQRLGCHNGCLVLGRG